MCRKGIIRFRGQCQFVVLLILQVVRVGRVEAHYHHLVFGEESVKIPKGLVENVLVKVDKFYYLVDFVVLDTEPMATGANYVPILLGRPFLATSNAIINCRNGVMQLTFGNMTLELNIFYLSSKHEPSEEQEPEEVWLIGTSEGENCAQKLQKELMESIEEFDEELFAPVTSLTPPIPPTPPDKA